MTISAVLGVYNEETRIEATLRCATWCDEIVVIDKHSTDRTREIALEYTGKVYQIPFSECNPNELQCMVDFANSEWIIWVTASDLIHPGLAAEIRKLVDRVNVPFDVIHVPYRRYVLGLEGKHSPWFSNLHPAVFRKRVFNVNPESLHGAMLFNTNRHFHMSISRDYCMYHLTHETMDGMMERHLRYCHVEAEVSPPTQTLAKEFNMIFPSAMRVILKRKSFLMGWNGFALGIAYISYWMMRFLYIWEKRRSKAPQTYAQIRRDILQKWQDTSSVAKNR